LLNTERTRCVETMKPSFSEVALDTIEAGA
jgi:hypothetical protein